MLKDLKNKMALADGDPYTDLSYEEAKEICQALNEEAEEELFKIKRI